MVNLLNKDTLRKIFTSRRDKIPSQKRKKAEDNIFKYLQLLFQKFVFILSFSSKDKEINLWPINRFLTQKRKLLLPKIENDTLKIFHITNIEKQLSWNSKFSIFEPDPKKCRVVEKDKIHCALVPGIVFDQQKHRIGYGKGYYDRFLSSLTNCYPIGIGYKEQRLNALIPIEKHDISMQELFLF